MWESRFIEAKLQRMTREPMRYRHLMAVKGGRLPDGRLLRRDWLAPLKRLCTRRVPAPLRIVR
jgi:hypothetical protein